MTKLKNASQMPKVYYGLHMVEGVAEYRPEGDEMFRVYVAEKTIKNMDSTFIGKPVYVLHVDSVDLDKIHEADGYVVESFFNKADGKHWCKFLVTSDKGHEAISKGWKLSNAYYPKKYGNSGLSHGVEYQKEILDAEYEHLAIVPNPRYQESVILTPEQFKTYNEEKESELKLLANAQENKKGKSMFNFFKKEKLENGADLEQTMVALPKTKKEMSIAQLITNMDEMLVKEESKLCNLEHMVKIGDEEMEVGELVKKYMDLMASKEEKKENEEEVKKEEIVEEKKENEEEEKDEDKKENEEEIKEEEKEEKMDKKENSMDAYFESLKNAESKVFAKPMEKIDLASDKVARGQQRYGSGK